MLSIIATPIGNLGDISFRAVEALKSADVIACEDTRHTKILLDHYAIRVPTTSFFQHNRLTKADYLLGLLKEGKHIALVSDAGTPGILDPGYNLINLAITFNIPMTFIPGPTAFINALVLSGKPAHRFIFEGFLPVKQQARKNRLKELIALDCTFIFYESCHRIFKALGDLQILAPQRQICCCRELTKKFEEVIRGTPEEVAAHLRRQCAKGEFVLVC